MRRNGEGSGVTARRDLGGAVIVGGGLAGSMMAAMLGRRDIEVDVYERRPDPRTHDLEDGRSINLALSTRGLTALDALGLADEALKLAIPMRGRMIHDEAGATQLQPYGRNGECIHSISRTRLNRLLVEHADRHDHVRFHFERRIEDLDLRTMSARVLPNDRDEAEKGSHINPRFFVGADGAWSAVRSALKRGRRTDLDQSFIEYGYKELTIPASDEGGFLLDPNALHIWPRQDFMMIALPNPDGTFTCTLFLPFEGERRSFALLDSLGDVRPFFDEHFSDALSLMPELNDEFARNPTSSLVTIRCNPWHLDGRAVLVGDAAHAIVPFYGQGMNAAFEDCRILDELLAECPEGDPEPAFAEYSRSRKPDGDAIAALALANFVEMRSHVTSPIFLARKRVDHMLARALPGRWRPLYEMVTFSNMPYSEAMKRAEEQQRVLNLGGAALAAGTAALGLIRLRARER